jgi:hypothetical protein
MLTVYNLRPVTVADEAGERTAWAYEGMLDDEALAAALLAVDPSDIDADTARAVAAPLAVALQASGS